MQYSCFQASAAMQMTSALFWDITQQRYVLCYIYYVPTFQGNLSVQTSSEMITSLVKVRLSLCLTSHKYAGVEI